jgi:hypothetical protein
MIVVIPQLICCGISTKSEILRDHDAPLARAPRVSPRMGITHHLLKRYSLAEARPAQVMYVRTIVSGD